MRRIAFTNHFGEWLSLVIFCLRAEQASSDCDCAESFLPGDLVSVVAHYETEEGWQEGDPQFETMAAVSCYSREAPDGIIVQWYHHERDFASGDTFNSSEVEENCNKNCVNYISTVPLPREWKHYQSRPCTDFKLEQRRKEEDTPNPTEIAGGETAEDGAGFLGLGLDNTTLAIIVAAIVLVGGGAVYHKNKSKGRAGGAGRGGPHAPMHHMPSQAGFQGGPPPIQQQMSMPQMYAPQPQMQAVYY